MSLIFNGTTIPSTGTIKYNGTSLTKVIYDGNTVWTKDTNVYLYNSGVENTSLHGGFKAYKRCGFGWGWYDDADEYGTCSITRGASTITFTGVVSKYGSIMCPTAINLTNYSKLIVVSTKVNLVSSGGPRVGFATSTSTQFSGTYMTIDSSGTKTLDISSLTGKHYFAIAFQNKCVLTASKIYLVP